MLRGAARSNLMTMATILVVSLSGCAPNPVEVASVAKIDGVPFESFFAKRIHVFGIPIHATANAPDAKVLHAAGVLAQYLDNDADGAADDSFLVETIVERDGRLFMAVDRDELDEIFERIEEEYPGSLAKAAWWINPEGVTPGGCVWQDLQVEETILPGDGNRPFDGSLEEVLHLITHVGLANAYPDTFAEALGSRLADAMDKARGGRFLGVPVVYPEHATYSYYDETCVYQCQATEYIYWALTSLMGGQDGPGRFEEIGEEWKLNTPEKLATGDPVVFALLTDPEYKLPSVLPDGNYLGGTLAIVTD